MNIDVVVKYPSDTDIVDVNGPEFARYEDIILKLSKEIDNCKHLESISETLDEDADEPSFILKFRNIKSNRYHKITIRLIPSIDCTEISNYDASMDIDSTSYANWHDGVLQFKKLVKELK